MIISNQQVVRALKLYHNQSQNVGKVKPKAVVRSADHISLSPGARQIQLAQQVIAATPYERTEKITSLAVRIASGQYAPEASAVVEKLVARTLIDKLV